MENLNHRELIEVFNFAVPRAHQFEPRCEKWQYWLMGLFRTEQIGFDFMIKHWKLYVCNSRKFWPLRADKWSESDRQYLHQKRLEALLFNLIRKTVDNK